MNHYKSHCSRSTMFHSKSMVIVVVRRFHSPWNGMVLLSTEYADLQGITTSLCNALFTCRLVVCLAHGSDVMPKKKKDERKKERD